MPVWNTPAGHDWEEIASAAGLKGAHAARLAERLRLRHEGSCSTVKVEDGSVEVDCLDSALTTGWEWLG